MVAGQLDAAQGRFAAIGHSTTAIAGPADHPPPGLAPRSGTGSYEAGDKSDKRGKSAGSCSRCGVAKLRGQRGASSQEPGGLGGFRRPVGREAFTQAGFRGAVLLSRAAAGWPSAGVSGPAACCHAPAGHQAAARRAICHAELSTNRDRLYSADLCWARLIISVTFVRIGNGRESIGRDHRVRRTSLAGGRGLLCSREQGGS